MLKMAERNILLEFYKSIVDNDIRKLREHLKDGVNVNYRFEDQHLIEISDTVFEFTPLHLACQYGNAASVDLLLEYGADLFAFDQWKETPLMHSLWRMHHQIAEKLLLLDPSLANHQQLELKCGLHLTLENNDYTGTELLLRYGATPAVVNTKLLTPLHIAVTLGERFTRLLLKNGAEETLNEQDRRLKTPLHYAVENGDIETMELLLKYKANPNIPDFRGFVPFMYCVFEMAKYPEKTEQITKLRLLLKSGSDVNTIGNERGQTVLHLLASPELHHFKNECTFLVLELLQSGADVNVRDIHGCTPFLLALSRKFDSIAKSLIAFNCDVNIGGELREYGGEFFPTSPFRLAYKYRLQSVLELMFSTGLSVSPEERLEFICDVDLMQMNPLFFSWLWEKLEHPYPLFQICRSSIRRSLGNNLRISIRSLCLPTAIVDFLMLKEHDILTNIIKAKPVDCPVSSDG